jgi:DNA-binding NarL/FixJ family response regulator
MATQILIVDDHTIVRAGVRSLLSALRPDWTIFEAGDGKEAQEAIARVKPDIVVMDVTMPGLSGLHVSAALRKSGFVQPILMFTMHSSRRLASEARDAGAQGYVLKSQAVQDLVRAIDTLLAGGTFFGEAPEVPAKSEDPAAGPIFCIGLSQLRLILMTVNSFAPAS